MTRRVRRLRTGTTVWTADTRSEPPTKTTLSARRHWLRRDSAFPPRIWDPALHNPLMPIFARISAAPLHGPRGGRRHRPGPDVRPGAPRARRRRVGGVERHRRAP